MDIDFRSDTVTRPSKEMLNAMLGAPVGDAVFDDDPSVHELQNYAADLFGVDGALFCPSGTMTNQIAIKVHTRPGDQLLCDKTAHVYIYEGGGAALHSGVSCRLLEGDRGRFSAQEVREAFQEDDPHFPRTRLVSVENTSNKGGGTIWDLDALQQIRDLREESEQYRDLRFHLDGARLFNALAETGESPKIYGEIFDSISVCLSKGLGAPVGSLLLGDKDFIYQADRMRKAFGGAMRQAGYLAKAGLFALQNHREQLKADHRNARKLSSAFAESRLLGNAWPAETNIVIYELAEASDLEKTMIELKRRGLRAVNMGPTLIRLVTHRDVTDEMIEKAVNVIGELRPS